MELLRVACLVVLGIAVLILTLYAIRHYWLAAYRLSLSHPRDTMELVGFVMPRISVLVPMHNEERVAADVLHALVECDYDHDRLEILAINDRSTDRTAEIVDQFAGSHPIIKAIHRTEGEGGKGEALLAATGEASGEILLLFDADYFPGRSMLKMLAAPFCDPEVGAVMGRVVPHNASASLLSALLSLERAAGYQVGQQARHNLSLTPQFGGTVGGVRTSALRAVGGWNPESLTEDTDLTYRLVANGWRVAYVNRAECYEEVPEAWTVRSRQIARWAVGHTECLRSLAGQLIRSRHLSFSQKVENLAVLGCYLTAPVLVLGWIASLILLFLRRTDELTVFPLALAFAVYQMFGNQATFFEHGVAALLDGTARRALLTPLNLFNFLSSTAAICAALVRFYGGALIGRGRPRWQKTQRFRAREDAKDLRSRSNNGSRMFIQGADGSYAFRAESGNP
jgi:cellulose synthase/poly-beta-1,6-N-acetylglucosamine synthase-like glycosyltransferase